MDERSRAHECESPALRSDGGRAELFWLLPECRPSFSTKLAKVEFVVLLFRVAPFFDEWQVRKVGKHAVPWSLG